MKFADIERSLDKLSTKGRIEFLERMIPRLHGKELRPALIVLANLFVLQRQFEKAAETYELLGMPDEAVKARSRITV